MTTKKTSRKGPITIRVAYGWDPAGVRKDARWNGLRKFLSGVVDEALKRRTSAIERDGAAEVRPANIWGPDRLLAMPGELLHDSIFERIKGTDILVADLSRGPTGERTPNVLLEIGAALANGRTRVFLVEDRADAKPGQLEGVSDLQGFYVTRLQANPETDADTRASLLNAQTSLRMTLVGAVVRLLRDRGMWPEGWTTEEGESNEAGPTQVGLRQS